MENFIGMKKVMPTVRVSGTRNLSNASVIFFSNNTILDHVDLRKDCTY